MNEPLAPAQQPWYRSTQNLLTALALGAVVAVVALVLHTSAELGRMPTDVAVAQGQAANLANAQREVLKLQQASSDPAEQAAVDKLELHRGLLVRQLEVAKVSFPVGSSQHEELTKVLSEATAIDLGLVAGKAPTSPARTTLTAQLEAIEVRVKKLYDGQGELFYDATAESVKAKRNSQYALVGLVVLMALAGMGWAATTRQRTRSDLARAYDALVGEMHERKAAETALRTSERRFRSLVQGASDLTAVTDLDGLITYVSPSAETNNGFKPDDLIGQPCWDYVHGEDQEGLRDMLAELAKRPGESAMLEVRTPSRDGGWRTIEVACRNLTDDPAVRGIVWNGRDVTERRNLQDQLTHQAFHDSLTGLPNRALLLQRLEAALAEATRTEEHVAVVLIDLDGFKAINDTLGHAAGDELLRVVSSRLAGSIRLNDTPARLGGDEFAVVVRGRRPADAGKVAERVLAAASEPLVIRGVEVAVGASIGMALRHPGASAADLLRDADIAMYAAKTAGKNRIEVFRAEMRDETTERSTLQRELLRAVEQDEIIVHYQPIVDLRSGAVVAVEALARWQHPTRGLLLPGAFISMAEDCGAIRDIGARVLDRATRAAAYWRANVPGCADLVVTVNVSGRQIQSGDLVGATVRALAGSGLPPRALALEITESVLVDDTASALGEFQQLRQLGVRLAVDDFGAGYSSLGTLTRFPVDILKLDRTMLELDAANDGTLVQAVSELGRTLGLLVIAEGAESVEHVTRARNAGCQAVQGFVIARPIPEDEIRLLLQRAAATDHLAALVRAPGTSAPPVIGAR